MQGQLKQTWFIIFFCFQLLSIVLFVASTMMGRSQSAPIPALMPYTMAAIGLAMCLIMIPKRMTLDQKPQVFFSGTVVCLGCSELVFLAGYVGSMGHSSPLVAALPFFLVMLALNFGLILPKGLNYWSQKRDSD